MLIDPFAQVTLATVPGWTCPECERQFGRRNQSHECVPGMTESEYFASGAALEREVYDAVVRTLQGLAPLTIEFLTVGIAFKRARTFAELRPMRNRVRLWFALSRVVEHPRVVKVWRGSGTRAAIVIDLRSAAEVDDEVRDWLTEAFMASPE